MSETKSIPNNQIICTEFDGGEGILVDLNTRKYYQLNETALLIWKRLEKGATVDEIVADVVDGYDVPTSHARTSVENTLARFRSYSLICE